MENFKIEIGYFFIFLVFNSIRLNTIIPKGPVHLAVACDVFDGVFLCCLFSHEMSWMRS